MADFLGYLSQFTTDTNVILPLHDPAQGVYVEGLLLPSISYRTLLTPLASGVIHDADGNQRSKFDVATVDHTMVINKSNLATIADFMATKVYAAAGYAGTVTKKNHATGATATARARLQQVEIVEPDKVVTNILKVILHFEFLTWF